jgi:uncharacterized protein with ATP-grasp and redox domains
MVGVDEETQKESMREAMKALVGLDFSDAPALIATRAIRAAERLYPGVDPFERVKRETTAEALGLYESIKPGAMELMAAMGPVDRLKYCAKLGAAGNIIDFGISSDFDLEATLKETMEGDLAIDCSKELHEAITRAKTFLLVSDNAGEIVFDRFLLDEVLRLGKQVYVSVKSGPVLNDAVRSDAEAAGIADPIKVIETGSASLGVIYRECSREFMEIFRDAGVVLSKGQANYETLDDAPRDVFFILRAKCPVLARPIGVATGSSVLIHYPGPEA